ncbi:hypothetical protein WA158_001402 [Blastocystis sp. Blastoise]
MSGIPNSDDCIDQFETLKLRKNCRWIVYKIESKDGKDLIVVDSIGEREKTWNDLPSVLPDGEPRFVVFDLDCEYNGMPVDKLLFIAWAPDNSKIRQRVMYSSCQRAFHSRLLGSRYLEIHNKDDLDLAVITKKV